VKAATEARLNAYALNPRAVAVSVPPASGEQRAEMARHVTKLGEEAKVAVRTVRQDASKQTVTTSMSRGTSRPVVRGRSRGFRRFRRKRGDGVVTLGGGTPTRWH
jgi:hypothetical protein